MRIAWVWALWVLILIPLSIDNSLSIPIGDYDLRPQYFVTALLALVTAWGWVGSPSSRVEFFSRLKEKYFLCFTAMMGVGGLGWLGSPYPSRSLMFLLWTSGTILGLMLLIPELWKRLGAWIPRTLAVYGLIQSVLISIDAAVCPLTGGTASVARVMVYGSPGSNLLCRPHAFYQEPGYFCAFALLLWVYLRDRVECEKDGTWKKVLLVFLVLSPVAMLLSTSRMGMLGAVALVGIEAARFFQEKKRRHSGQAVKAIGSKWMLRGGGIAAGILIAAFALGYGRLFYDHFIHFLAEPWSDLSFRYRFVRLDAAWQVFLKNPWVGAGPGAAGAYLVDHIQWHHVWQILDTENRLLYQRRDPLSLNLYTELLSEWGSLGTVFFFAGLGFLARGWGKWNQLCFWAALLVIYTATQTLARFDLWLLLALMAAVAREKRAAV